MKTWIRRIYHCIDLILQKICGWLPAPLYRLIKRLHRMLTYGFMGVVNTAVEMLVFVLCFRLLRVPAGISHAVGFLCASAHGYMLNSNLTFSEGRGRSRGQFIQYVGVDVVLMAVSSYFMDWIAQTGVPVMLIELAVAVCTGVIHYIVYKFLVFRIRKEDKDEA